MYSRCEAYTQGKKKTKQKTTCSALLKQMEGERHSNTIELFLEGIGWAQPRHKKNEGHPLASQRKKRVIMVKTGVHEALPSPRLTLGADFLS